MFAINAFLNVYIFLIFHLPRVFVFTIHIGIVRFLDLPFVDVLTQNARRSYSSRRCLQILSGYRTVSVHDVRTDLYTF